MAKVSVILTSFNHEKYIKEAIDSVLAQTFEDFELIIWDDASTDDSWEVIQSYTDSRIKSFKSDRTERGLINKALLSGELQGEYIAIHHSDDVWELTKLEKQVAFLDANKEYGAVFTHVKTIDEYGMDFYDPTNLYCTIFEQPNRTRHQWLNYFFYIGNVLCHPSLMIRRECYELVGFYKHQLMQLPDYDMWIRVCMAFEIYILQEELTKFRVRSGNKNSSAVRLDSVNRTNIELYWVLRNYLNINCISELQLVFPEYFSANSANLAGKTVTNALGLIAVETNNRQQAKLFGLDILYNSICDSSDVDAFKKLNKLTGDYKIFADS